MSGRIVVAASCVLLGVALAAPAAETPAQVAFFEKEVLPVLQAHCLKCHGGDKTRGGLDLTSRAALLKGGDSGPAVSLDKPEQSRLLQAISYKNDLEMPPSGKLSDAHIALLTRWVKEGVPYRPGNEPVVKKPEGPGGKVTPESKNYWAYRPVQRPKPPAVKDTRWVANPIDAFVLARLEAKGLTPAAPADRAALVRRATYDLTGLPPSPDEIDAFVNDKSADAYEKLLDRLLASPHYGEKWGRHWLDLVRYAETNGYERDGPKPFAWRYRDYVIKSFNDDKPHDRFLREQLAGDEMPSWSADAVVATGYYRLGLWDDEPVDPKQARYDELDDIVATTAQVMLGMTMNCARCHEHKIDPIPQADYYRLLAFFLDIPHFSDTRNTSSRFNLSDVSPPEKRARYEGELKRREQQMDALKAEMTPIEDAGIKKMPAEDQRAAEGIDRPRVVKEKLELYLAADALQEYRRLRDELTRLQKLPLPERELALSVNNCFVSLPQAHVLVRGNAHAPGARVQPGFPEVLGYADPKLPTPGKDARSSGRRTVLADWITRKDNPLTARVMVNRLWQHHFGRGIVASANDFGKFGERPTHPELLDWLASELTEGGWKLKRMHKLLMLSSTYRMAAKGSEKGLQIDPGNSLLWRFNPRRLTAEEVRDTILSVSGQLNRKGGGPSVYPPLPREVLAGQSRPGEGWGQSTREEAARRSVYVYVKRSLSVPLLSQHDQADPDSSCPVRYTTTVPTQALGLLNGAFSHEQAAFLAARLLRETPGDVEAQVRRAIRLTTGRAPGADEVKKDAAFLARLRQKDGLDDKTALRHYALLLLNTNEFLYLD